MTSIPHYSALTTGWFTTAASYRMLCLIGLLALLLMPSGSFAADDENPEADSTEQPAAALPRVLPDINNNRHQGVIGFLGLNGRDGEQIRLIADDREFYGLFMQEESGSPQGGILILHDDGQHSHWPETVAPLREKLPLFGWATFAVALPDTPLRTRLPRPVYDAPPTEDEEAADEDAGDSAQDTADTTAPDPAPDPAADPATEEPDSNGLTAEEEAAANADDSNSAEPALPRLQALPPLPEPEPQPDSTDEQPAVNTAESYRDTVRERVRQSVQYLNQRGQLNVVIIACGASAGWAVDFMLQRPRTIQTDDGEDTDRGYTLVMIDAKENAYDQVPLVQKLGELEIPVLDLISEDSGVPARTVQQRAGHMRHLQREDYQQIRVPSFAEQYDDNNIILRRVRGWLRTNAAGNELPGQR